MEKPGMDRGYPSGGPGLLKLLKAGFPLAGLLALAGLLLPAAHLEAQNPPRLETETFPQSPLAGEYWAIRFLVDHPLPREVEVELSPLPPALSLDRIRVEPRLTEDANGEARRQTMLEYYFFLNAAGRISLAPFEFSIPVPEETQRIRFLSPAIQFIVRAPGETGTGQSSPARNPRLSWRRPAQLHPGEEAELVLVYQDWDLPLPLPSQRLLMPRTPVGAILEASPPQEDDEAAGVLLRLRLIPLEEGRLNIPGFKVPAGDYSLDIPALSIPVSPVATQNQPAAAGPAVSVPSGLSPEEPPPVSREDLPFPEISPKPLPLFRAGCESIRSRARALWDKGLRVEALAELRRNERDYTGGPALIPLRREAEKLLGLHGNGDETWRPRFLLTGIFIVSVALTGVFLFPGFFLQKKQVTPGPARCYRVVGKLSRFQLKQPYFKKSAWIFRIFAIFFVLPALFSLWKRGDLYALELPFPGLSRPALTREAEAFRVPGPAGAAAFRFEEGRRVLARSIRGDWAYVEIPARGEGRKAGWARIEALVFY